MAARAPCKRHLTRLCRSTPDKLPSSRAWASSVGGRSVRPLGMHAAQMMSPTRHFPAGNAGLSKNIFARPSCPWPTSSVTLPLSRQMRLKHGGKKGGKSGKGNKGGGKGAAADVEDGVESLDDIASVADTNARFDRVLEGLKNDFQGLRGGKTDPGMLDNIKVESYGTMSPLASVAQSSMKGPQLIVLTVYDPGMTHAVENAIRESDMGLNPSSEGQGQVNVPIPKPTKDSREAVAKVAGKHAEKSKVVLRGIRHKVTDQIKKNKDSFPEDDVHQRLKEIDQCTQDAEARAMKMLEKKKADILTV